MCHNADSSDIYTNSKKQHCDMMANNLNATPYCRMVIELMKESLTNANRVNPDESLRVLTEIETAITTARITGQPTDELCQLKADVELVRNLN